MNKDDMKNDKVNDKGTSEIIKPDDYVLDDKKKKDVPSISLPGATESSITEANRYIKDLDINENDPAFVNWRDAITNGRKRSVMGDIYGDRLEKGNWKQSIKTEKGELYANAPSYAPMTGARLSGNDALLRAMDYLGEGKLFHVPLPHSGFWITLKPFGEDDILELYRIISSDKIDLGRYTYGAIFSNISAYTENRFFRLATKYIDESTCALDINGEYDWGDIINKRDIPFIIWGMACSQYPNGFNYDRGCTVDVSKCNHVVEGLISLQKLIWFDDSFFTEGERNTMAKRVANSIPVDDVLEYQKKIDRSEYKSHRVDIDTTIIFNFKTPSINQSIDYAENWIEDINSTIENSLTKSNDNDERNRYISQNSLATYMRQYGNWVESIELENGNIVEDEDAVISLLNFYSSNATIRTSFHKSVQKYIADGSCGVIGIPKYECPNCKGVVGGEEGGQIIPLDSVSVFFTILGERMERILRRR